MNTSVVRLEREFREELPRLLNQHRESAKIIAFDAGITRRQFQKIKAGAIPGGFTLLLLARKIPALNAKLREWLDAESSLSPEIDRLTLQLAAAVQAHMERKRP